jgi:hypothetical protein
MLTASSLLFIPHSSLDDTEAGKERKSGGAKK